MYKKDKCLALSYIAAGRQFSLSYREQSEESRRSCAVKRRIQRSRLVDPDHQAQLGPPDKSKNFRVVPPLRNKCNVPLLKPKNGNITMYTHQSQIQIP